MENLNTDELKDWRCNLKIKLKVDAVMYIDTILFGNNYEKGQSHWDMMEHLCEYMTGKTFIDDSSLYQCLHAKSQVITDNLDKEVGLKIVNHRNISNKMVDRYATILCDKMICMVDTMLGDNDTFTRYVKPTKLVSPVRKLTV